MCAGRGTDDEADDYCHRAGPEENYNESVYYNFFDRSSALGGFVRCGNRINEGQAEMTVLSNNAGADLGFVIVHHLTRILLVITGAPLAARLMRVKDGGPGGGPEGGPDGGGTGKDSGADPGRRNGKDGGGGGSG